MFFNGGGNQEAKSLKCFTLRKIIKKRLNLVTKLNQNPITIRIAPKLQMRKIK